MKMKKLVVTMFAAGVLASPLANATNGYFAIGYGVKSQSMGGVGIALPQDALAAAANPAGMVSVGDRADVGLEFFKPVRSTVVSGSPGVPGTPTNGNYDGNHVSSFLVPNFGYNKMISSDSSVGVSVYGNGGMNSDYTNNPFGTTLGGQGNGGVNLMQLFVAPTWSMKINPTNAIGVSLNLAYQQFSAKGLQGFAGFSSAGAQLTNDGTDSSSGYGLHLGWTGQVSPSVTLGAMYQTKTKMGKFSRYSGLFAGQGSFDIPATYGVGIAVKATPATTIAMDLQSIRYGDVPAIANPASNLFVLGNPMGSSNGPGFGWQNMNVVKLGISQKISDTFTLRAGYNHNSQQIPQTQTFLNILAPGVVQNHLTLGGTWTLADKSEVSVGYVHAFSQTVNGVNSLPAGGNANITMHEDSLMVSYGW